jgi:hypothetical protein
VDTWLRSEKHKQSNVFGIKDILSYLEKLFIEILLPSFFSFPKKLPVGSKLVYQDAHFFRELLSVFSLSLHFSAIVFSCLLQSGFPINFRSCIAALYKGGYSQKMAQQTTQY